MTILMKLSILFYIVIMRLLFSYQQLINPADIRVFSNPVSFRSDDFPPNGHFHSEYISSTVKKHFLTKIVPIRCITFSHTRIKIHTLASTKLVNYSGSHRHHILTPCNLTKIVHCFFFFFLVNHMMYFVSCVSQSDYVMCSQKTDIIQPMYQSSKLFI